MLLIIYGKSLETNMRLIGVWLNKLRKEHYTAIKIRKHSTLLEKKSTGVFLMKKPRFGTTMYLCSYFCVRKRGRKYILCLLVLYLTVLEGRLIKYLIASTEQMTAGL